MTLTVCHTQHMVQHMQCNTQFKARTPAPSHQDLGKMSEATMSEDREYAVDQIVASFTFMETKDSSSSPKTCQPDLGG
jgi:hypothetical protein